MTAFQKQKGPAAIAVAPGLGSQHPAKDIEMNKATNTTAPAGMKANDAPRNLEGAVNALLSEATAHANSQFTAVRVHAKLLGEYMGELHGGSWEVDVDHEAGFILIRPSLKRERVA